MKNCLLLLCTLSVFVLMNCSERKVVEENKTEQTAPPTSEILDEGVVIGKQLLEDTLKGSLKAYTKESVGGAEFKITYHAPAVRGRIVWGGLVPFNKVWVTGAHMATTIECNIDFMLGNQTIVAGKYGLFTIPGKDKWTVIINKNWQQHLTDEYDPKDDVARVEIVPSQLPENQERLRYEIISQSAVEGFIRFSWEKLQLQVPVTIDAVKLD